MDIVFGVKEEVDGEVWIPISTGDNKPVFKQFNNVVIDEVNSDTIRFNLQGKTLESYDEDLKSAAKENKIDWFGRDVSDKVIDNAYRSPAFEGTLQTVPLRSGDDNEVRVKCFDNDKKAIEFGDLKEGTVCSVVVELKRLWFVKRNFGPEWYSIQIKIHKVPVPKSDPYDGYLFQDDA
tara:strand:+ start:213 stop:746 length:534 start_codon:yes stop_codon:yes gene_type:complete